MKVNGNDFSIYLLDTEISVTERVASNMNALPQYILFEPKLDINKLDHDFFAIDIIDIIRTDAKNNTLVFPSHRIDFNIIQRAEAERFFVAFFENPNLLGFIEGLELNPFSVEKKEEILNV
jgi:hypothetical protein